MTKPPIKKTFILQSEEGILGAFSNRQKAFKVISGFLGENNVYQDFQKRKVCSLPTLSRRLMLEKEIKLENSYGEWVKINKCVLNKEPNFS